MLISHFSAMNKKAMLEELISHFTKGNKAQFANMLGIQPQTINSWQTRNTFDAELIYSKCEDISGDWLLSGTGPMLKSARNNEQAERKLIDICKSLVKVYEQKDSLMGELMVAVKDIDK